MRLIDEQFLETPWYGPRRMARHLRRHGWCVGHHRVRRLMLKMGLAPIYQRPKTSEPHPQHRIWPYLLRHLTVDRPNQVWCADVTYIQMRKGFLHPVSIMNWFSRYAVTKVRLFTLQRRIDALDKTASLNSLGKLPGRASLKTRSSIPHQVKRSRISPAFNSPRQSARLASPRRLDRACEHR